MHRVGDQHGVGLSSTVILRQEAMLKVALRDLAFNGRWALEDLGMIFSL